MWISVSRTSRSHVPGEAGNADDLSRADSKGNIPQNMFPYVIDPQETKELFVQLKLLREQGFGLIFISHKLEEVMELCDR